MSKLIQVNSSKVKYASGKTGVRKAHTRELKGEQQSAKEIVSDLRGRLKDMEVEEDDFFGVNDVGVRVIKKGLSRAEKDMLYSPLDFSHPILASYKVSQAEKEIFDIYAEERGLNINPEEYSLIKMYSWGEISPNRFKRYISLRGKDMNPNSKSRKVSFEEMNAFAKAGILTLPEVEALLSEGVRPDDIVQHVGNGNFQLLPEWKEWHDVTKSVHFSHVNIGNGRVQVPIREAEFAFIDLETSGTERDASIIEIAIRRVRGDGTLIATMDTLVDPGEKRIFMGQEKDVYENVAATTHVHEIRPEDLDGAPTFEQLAEPVKELLQGAIVVAQYDKFEQDRLSYEFSRLGEVLPPFPSYDTQRTSKYLFDLKKKKDPKTGESYDESKLGNMYKKFTGKKLKNAHHAMADVIATEKVAFIAFDHLEKNGISTLGMMSPPPTNLAKEYEPYTPKKRSK